MTSTVTYSADDGIGTITLDRPERRNAINLDLVREMSALLVDLEESDDLAALIVTGGSDVFSAGADLKALQEKPEPTFLDEIRALLRRIEDFPWPVIAAINGPCLAGGFEMAISCDLRVAGEDAVFGLPEIKFGALAIAGATQRLPRLIGPGLAKELHFLGESISAREAYRMGILNRLTAPDDVMPEARRIGRSLRTVSSRGLRMAKHLINRGLHMDPAAALEFEAEVSTGLFADLRALHEDMSAAADRDPVYKKIFVDE
jgi:enoyl-CoA hydratase